MLEGSRLMIAQCGLSVLVLLVPAAQAQNWSWDARRIGMGGSGSTGNLAGKMIEERRSYTSIVLPLGLSQVLSDTSRFDPNSKRFDPILDVEYAASPWHYVIGRDPSDNPGQASFVNDVRNGTLSRDLIKYKGFVPTNDLLAVGLVAPSFGKTIKVHRDGANFQGFYLGLGPYISLHSRSTISTGLTTVLSTGVNQRNASFPIREADQEQAAAAVIGGYRARFSLPPSWGSGSDREGLYVAANYNYLRGFGYSNNDLGVTLLTDSGGLITSASNVLVANRYSTRGTGLAVDIGVGAVVRRRDFGFGAKGIGNRIDWTNVKQRTFTLASVVSGSGNFIRSPTTVAADTRVELPVDYRGDVAYHADRWSVIGELGHGFGGGSFHGGMEWRANRIFELRGGGRYTVQKWNPTGGIGIDAGRKVSFDLAVFGTNANIERKHRIAIAASFRFNHIKNEAQAKS